MQIKWLLLTILWTCVVPERALQDWHAASLQDLQLQESHFLRPLWQFAVGPVQTRPQVWRWAHTFFSVFGIVKQKLCVVSVTYFFSPPICFPRSTLRADCGMNVHCNCQKKVANLCGINQKLLAEALSHVSQVCAVPCCVHCTECNTGEEKFHDLTFMIFFFILSCSYDHDLCFFLFCLSFFLSFFRDQRGSLTNQMPQILESTKMSVMQQQTLVVRFMHCTAQLNNNSPPNNSGIYSCKYKHMWSLK